MIWMGWVIGCASQPVVVQSGIASFYGPGFEGKPTASGVPFDPSKPTAAHRTLPFGTRVRVSTAEGAVVVTVNDRGPYAKDRIIDLSLGAAEALGIVKQGTAQVQLQVVHCPSGETCTP